MYLKGVFSVLCFFCCMRSTYSPLPVVMALAHISTLMTHNYIITLLQTCVSPMPQPCYRASASQTDGCEASGLNWTPTKQTSSFSGHVSKSRRQTFTLSNSVASTFIYQLPSHAWESSMTVSWNSQLISSAWLDGASTSFVSCALSIAPYQLRLQGHSSIPSSSVAWTIETASLDPRVLFTSIPYSAS